MPVQTPELSIVIPAYNRGETIFQCVESALEQRGGTSEVIVVDDGSTDGTRDILSSFGSQITVLHRGNQGACAARNMGLHAARGDSIAFLDSDDYYASDLAGTLHNLRKGSGVDMAIGSHSLDLDGIVRRVDFLRPNETREKVLETFSDGWVVQTAAICWCRQFVEKIGGWNPQVLQWQDVEFYMRALMLGAKMEVFDEEGAIVREYLDRSRISHKVTEQVLNSQLDFIEQLAQLADPKYRPYIANLYYKLARHALRHGHSRVGQRALEKARIFGLRYHRGSRRHQVLSFALGLELKERASTWIKPIYYN